MPTSGSCYGSTSASTPTRARCRRCCTSRRRASPSASSSRASGASRRPRSPSGQRLRSRGRSARPKPPPASACPRARSRRRNRSSRATRRRSSATRCRCRPTRRRRSSSRRRRRWAGLRGAEASYDCFRRQAAATSEGSVVEQVLTETGAGLLATAASPDDVQRRSYPQSVPRAIKGQRGDFATAGWEHVESLRLVEEAPRVGAEALALLEADPCPSAGRRWSCRGRRWRSSSTSASATPAELDRALGSEASLAGGSVHAARAARSSASRPTLVSITADGTLPQGMGSYGFDDEGVPAQRTVVVEDGSSAAT